MSGIVRVLKVVWSYCSGKVFLRIDGDKAEVYTLDKYGRERKLPATVKTYPDDVEPLQPGERCSLCRSRFLAGEVGVWRQGLLLCDYCLQSKKVGR